MDVAATDAVEEVAVEEVEEEGVVTTEVITTVAVAVAVAGTDENLDILVTIKGKKNHNGVASIKT